MRYFLIYLMVCILISCQNNTEAVSKTNTSNLKRQADSVSISLDTVSELQQPCARYAEGLADFTNFEWVEYCVPLPTFEYEEVFDDDLQKGQHRFKSKKNKKNYFEITGMIRSDMEIELDDYFNNSIADYEENGKIITKKSKMNSIPGFYVQGYYNNKIYEERYTEVLWFRKEDVVLLEANYSIKDSAQWNTWLNSFITFTSACN